MPTGAPMAAGPRGDTVAASAILGNPVRLSMLGPRGDPAAASAGGRAGSPPRSPSGPMPWPSALGPLPSATLALAGGATYIQEGIERSSYSQREEESAAEREGMRGDVAGDGAGDVARSVAGDVTGSSSAGPPKSRSPISSVSAVPTTSSGQMSLRSRAGLPNMEGGAGLPPSANAGSDATASLTGGASILGSSDAAFGASSNAASDAATAALSSPSSTDFVPKSRVMMHSSECRDVGVAASLTLGK